MADFQSIAAVGHSLERFLNHCFSIVEPVSAADGDGGDGSQRTTARLVRTEDLTSADEAGGVIAPPAVSIFLYRVDLDNTTRPIWSAAGNQDGRAHLPLDLHFLLTPWASNATDELRILGRVMQCLDSTPILSGPILDPIAGWAPQEAVQLYVDKMSTEAVMRTFDSLPIDYKLSVCYGARVVRIDGRVLRADTPAQTIAVGFESISGS